MNNYANKQSDIDPFFTVITVCYNACDTIKDCIKSVLRQSFSDYEHIIIDGASSDKTVSIIKNEYHDKITFVSEKDKGIYDAMNKGIAMARGAYIVFLNADDQYTDNAVLKDVYNFLLANDFVGCYADLKYVDQSDVNIVKRIWQAGVIPNSKIGRLTWVPPHPTFFAKRELFANVGKFNIDYQLASDYDLMRRFLLHSEFNFGYLRRCIVLMRAGGATNKSIRNIVKQNLEIRRIMRKNKTYVSFLHYLILKFINRSIQSMKTVL